MSKSIFGATVHLLPNATHNNATYSGTLSSGILTTCMNSATSAFSDTNYNQTNKSENIYFAQTVVNAKTGSKYKCILHKFNLSSYYDTLTSLRVCVEGLTTVGGAAGDTRFYIYNVTSADWIEKHIFTDSEVTTCYYYDSTNITGYYNSTDKLLKMGSRLWTYAYSDTEYYQDLLNVTVTYTEGGGGTPYSSNVTQSFSFGNGHDKLGNFFRLPSQSFIINQENSKKSSLFRHLSQSLLFTVDSVYDELEGAVSYLVNATLSFVITPASQRTYSGFRNVQSSLSLNHMQTRAFQGFRYFSSSLAFNDASSRIMMMIKMFSQSFSLDDSHNRFISVFKSFSDSFSFSESSSRLQTLIRTFVQPITISDSYMRFISMLRNFMQSFDISDESARIVGVLRGVISSFQVMQDSVKNIGFFRKLSQSMNFLQTLFAENVGEIHNYFVNIIQSFSFNFDWLSPVGGLAKGHILFCREFDDSNQMDVFCRDINNVQYNLNCLVYRQIPFARFCHIIDDWYILRVFK